MIPESLQSVLTTADLDRRPSRPADHVAENEALRELMRALSEDPDRVLQRLVEVAMARCGAESAGLSVAETDAQGERTFRWWATAGLLASMTNGTMPYDASPCGLVLDRGATQLMERPARAYAACRAVQPPVVESLLAPFDDRGRLAGTLWVQTHGGGRPFEAEDRRLLESLAEFAAIAWRAHVDREAARTSAERYRRLFDSMHEGFCVVDLTFDAAGRAVDYRFREVNAAFESQTGLTARDVSVEKALHRIAPTQASSWLEACARAAKTGLPVHFEARAEAPRRWYDVRAFRLRGDGRTEVGILFRDVTERREAERALAEARARLERTLEHAEAATFDWDVPNDRMYGNALLPRFFGLDPLAAEGGPIEAFMEAIHPDDLPTVRVELATSLATGERFEMQHRVIGANGRTRWTLARGDVTLGADGQAVRLSGVALDVTDHVENLRALREREELFRTVFEEAPADAILVADADRRITAWNPAAERILGWRAAEVIGKPADIIFSPEDRERHAPEAETSAATRRGKAPNERWHVKKDGTRFWGSGTMNALHDAEGNVRGYLKVFRDATDDREETETLAFVGRLTDAIIAAPHADAIAATTAQMLGERLGASRVAFGVADPAATTIAVETEWAPDLPSLVGTHRIADFGPAVVADFQAGRTHVSRDAEREYEPGVGLEAVRAVGAMSGISVPLVRDERLAGLLVVHDRAPRDWSEREVALVRQVAERMLTVAQRRRAETSDGSAGS